MELEKTYIYQVYLKGSFSKAAEALFITQPALSIAIRKVEKEIGAAIFNRGQRPLTLTHVGKIYISHIKRELLLEQELKQQLDDLHGLKTGELFIGGTNYMNAYLLPPYISRFTEKYPNISINMSETIVNDINYFTLNQCIYVLYFNWRYSTYEQSKVSH